MAKPKAPAENRQWTKNRAAVYLPLPPMPPPDQISPVIFCVPDHPDWRASLYGAISLMGSWLAWQRDEAHTGKDVAQVWLNIIHSAQGAAERGEPQECMDWCSILLACLTGDAAVQEAIKNITLNQILTDPELQEALRELMIGGGGALPGQITAPFGEACEDAVIYGGTTKLVDQIDLNNIDLLEIIEVATNPAERAAIFVNAIPIFSASFTDEALAAFDNVVSAFQENYVAQSTVAFKKLLACELRCYVKLHRDCQPTFNDFYDFFVDKLGGEITTQTLFTDSITYLLTGIWTGPQIFYAMVLTQMTTFRWAQEWLGLDISNLKYAYKTGMESPNENWDEDCEDCGAAPDTPNFTLYDALTVRGFHWDNPPNEPIFISNGVTEGTDIWDIPFASTNEGSIGQAAFGVSGGPAHVISVTTALTGVTYYTGFYVTIQPWTTGNHLEWFAVKSGDIGPGTIRITIGPAI
jgi:hypothetical protein